jgi:hypothetical protein
MYPATAGCTTVIDSNLLASQPRPDWLDVLVLNAERKPCHEEPTLLRMPRECTPCTQGGAREARLALPPRAAVAFGHEGGGPVVSLAIKARHRASARHTAQAPQSVVSRAADQALPPAWLVSQRHRQVRPGLAMFASCACITRRTCSAEASRGAASLWLSPAWPFHAHSAGSGAGVGEVSPWRPATLFVCSSSRSASSSAAPPACRLRPAL